MFNVPMMEIVVQHPSSAAGAAAASAASGATATAAGSNVPAFLAKLWKMVDDPDTNELIGWSDEGNSFIVRNQSELTRHLLPFYYKHSNMASFVRQLNMYGFHKVVGLESGGLKSEKAEEMEFAHPYFLRGQETLLENIKRKVAKAPQPQFVPNMKTERVNEVLAEVSTIKDKQEDLDVKLDTMKKENEALWREVVALRQKHQSQQKIVNKLIQFLVSLVQPRMGSAAVKRRFPVPGQQLAIEDTYGAKEAKLDFGTTATSAPSIGDSTPGTVANSAGQNAKHQQGFVIKDVTNEQLGILFGGDGTSATFGPAIAAVDNPVIEQPNSPLTSILQGVDPSLALNQYRPPLPSSAFASPSAASVTATVATVPVGDPMLPLLPDLGSLIGGSGASHRPVLQREISKEDFDLEMNIMEKDLNNLKDILSGQITFDHSLITNLFNPEEPFILPDTMVSGGGAAAAASSPSAASAAAAAEAAAAAAAANIAMPKLHLGGKISGAGVSGGASAAAAIMFDDQQPSLFELTDMDEEDFVSAVDADKSGADAAASQMPPPQDAAADDDDAVTGSGAPQRIQADDLNTPLLVYDDSPKNPLFSSFGRKRK